MSLFGFNRAKDEWEATKKEALSIMAQDAMAEFSSNFAKQGSGNKKWKEVQRRIPGTVAYYRGDSDDHSRPILKGRTGDLEDEIRIASVDSKSAVIVDDVPYAQIQNEGGINGRGHVVPARPFMVQTPTLTREQLDTLKIVTGKVWRKV